MKNFLKFFKFTTLCVSLQMLSLPICVSLCGRPGSTEKKGFSKPPTSKKEGGIGYISCLTKSPYAFEKELF